MALTVHVVKIYSSEAVVLIDLSKIFIDLCDIIHQIKLVAFFRFSSCQIFATCFIHIKTRSKEIGSFVSNMTEICLNYPILDQLRFYEIKFMDVHTHALTSKFYGLLLNATIIL